MPNQSCKHQHQSKLTTLSLATGKHLEYALRVCIPFYDYQTYEKVPLITRHTT